MPRHYRYISADSHLEIDSKHWLDRVPAKYLDLAPRLVRQPDGSDAWLIGDKITRPAAAADLYGGKGRDNYVPFNGRYEGTPGAGGAEQRLREQNQDGIDAEVLFPSQQGGPKFGVASGTTTPTKPSCAPTTVGWRKNTAPSIAIG